MLDSVLYVCCILMSFFIVLYVGFFFFEIYNVWCKWKYVVLILVVLVVGGIFSVWYRSGGEDECWKRRMKLFSNSVNVVI